MKSSTAEMRERMDALAALARRSLPTMLASDEATFVHKVTWARGNLEPRGTNAWYAAVVAIGIASDDAGDVSGIHLGGLLDRLIRAAHDDRADPELIAGTTWALAAARDGRLRTALDILVRRINPRRSSSMVLGVGLSALAEAVTADRELLAHASPVAERLTSELLRRLSPKSALFRGMSHMAGPEQLLRWNLTSFANQVYPIQGLVRYATATEREPLPQLRLVADRLVAGQGELGQWSWLYSMKDGSVIERYPVYAVHQDAMAFMALAVLENAGLGRYRDALAAGLAWLFGENELRTPIVDFESATVSRCIQRRGAAPDGAYGMSRRQNSDAVFSSIGLRPAPGAHWRPGDLEVLQEDRPYHLGWLLYARSLIKTWSARERRSPDGGARPCSRSRGDRAG